MLRRFGFIVALAAGLAISPAAQAVSLSPLRYHLAIDPGKEQVVWVKVTNTDAVAATFKVRVGGAKQSEAGRPIFGNSLDEAEAWISPRDTKILLRSGEEKKVYFNVAVPEGTAPGTHTGALVVENIAKNTLSGQVATLLLIDVAGIVEEAATIESWQLPTFIRKPHLNADLLLKNNGTVAMPVRGTITISSVFGKKIDSREIALGGTVLPGTKRASHINERFPLVAGPYKVELLIRYGLSDTIIRREKTLWYFPVWLMVSIVMILVVWIGSRFRKFF